MRILMQIDIPHEPFNTLCREGTVGQVIGRCLEETRPESIYFTEQDGHRGAVAVYKIKSDSEVPRLAEPWFLGLSADCRMRVAMTPEDLKAAKLEDLGKSWR